MNVPKPRVIPVATPIFGPTGVGYIDRHTFWTWRCECGAAPLMFTYPAQFPSQSAACDAAAIHSRTHNAERIADRLDEWAGKRTDSRAGGAYWEGYLEGAALAQRDAADFIRKHLVGGAS